VDFSLDRSASIQRIKKINAFDNITAGTQLTINYLRYLFDWFTDLNSHNTRWKKMEKNLSKQYSDMEARRKVNDLVLSQIEEGQVVDKLLENYKKM
jgi:hypothetical protein